MTDAAHAPVALSPLGLVRAHLEASVDAVTQLRAEATRLDRWAAALSRRLLDDGQLLVAGNGGSAVLASHLATELVGRYRQERRPLRALSLASDQGAVTAIGNDYGFDLVFARQIAAHARSGDVVLLLTTSGRSPNLLAAAREAAACDATCWAMTGPVPNPLAALVDDALAVEAPAPAVQEAQQVAVHLLCELLDRHVDADGASSAPWPRAAIRHVEGPPGDSQSHSKG
jgi:D-sedoheptulose 7-phosphate isomerase